MRSCVFRCCIVPGTAKATLPLKQPEALPKDDLTSKTSLTSKNLFKRVESSFVSSDGNNAVYLSVSTPYPRMAEPFRKM